MKFLLLVCSKLRHGYETMKTTMWRKVYKRVEKLGKRWRRRATWKISSTLFSLNFHNFIVRKSIFRVELRGEEKVVGENEDEGDFEFRVRECIKMNYEFIFLHFYTFLLRYKLCERRNAKTQLFPSSRVFRDVLCSLSPFSSFQRRRQQTTNAVEINIFCHRTSQLSNVPYLSCYIEKVSKVPIWSLSWAPSEAIKLRSSTMFSISICIIRTFPNFLIIFKRRKNVRKNSLFSLFFWAIARVSWDQICWLFLLSFYHLSLLFILFLDVVAAAKKLKELCTFSLSTTLVHKWCWKCSTDKNESRERRHLSIVWPECI